MTRFGKQLTVLTILAVLLAVEAHAQGNRGRIEPRRNVAELPIDAELDAKRTKQALGNILKAYPPSLTQVLQLDPSLLSNTAYLAPYPKLADFLRDHPAVAHSPAFFVGAPKETKAAPKVTVTGSPYRGFDTLAYTLLLLGLVGGVAWLIRATIDHQKWLRLSRAQSDAQSKILERFTSNEDLLNFIQTPAGRHFLEASSMPMQPKAVSAPIAQILWSMQIGLVLFAGGVGLEIISSQAERDAIQTFHMLGVLVIALGVGFILSGFSSYILSRKLGLLNPTNVTSQPPPS